MITFFKSRIQLLTYWVMAAMLWAGVGSAMAENYAIEHVKDNVYRFTAGKYYAAFMVTDTGIFVTDPINGEAARWLKKELQQRFDVPVKFMAYSHNHLDHAKGGEVFDSDLVTVIAHDDAARDLHWTKAPTAMPELTFSESLTVPLGDSEVQLHYHGPNNGRGSVSMRFMPARVLYVVDWIVLGRMPYQDLAGYDIHGMRVSTEAVLEKPFEIFIGGHGDIGDYQDVVAYQGYLTDLYEAVRDGMLVGDDLATLQSDIHLRDYQHLDRFGEWRALNIKAVYETLLEQSYFHLRNSVVSPD